MYEPVGKLPVLTPDSNDPLTVIAYFDALAVARASLDGLLRAAAALAGTVAGAEHRGRIIRYDATGQRLDGDGSGTRTAEGVCGAARVWLERQGTSQATDDMIARRLALTVKLLETPRWSGRGLDIIIDAGREVDERKESLALLGIDGNAQIRIIASRDSRAEHDLPSTVLPTRYGMMRATIDTSGSIQPSGRAGLGTWVRADRAPDSWDAAVIAYRLTDSADRVVDATGLGAALLLVRAYDPDVPHPDVTRLDNLDALEFGVLRTLVEADSIRSAAARLGMHHSSVQSRYEALIREVGYDPRTPLGRLRYSTAVLLQRLSHPADD